MNNKPISSRLGDTWNDFVNKYDIGAFPAFMIFFVVVTLGMALNFLAMRHAIGDFPALLVSGLFEFGILGWKWTGNRKRNNDTQTELVGWAIWLSVILAVIMLVINLFRTTIEQSLSAEPVTGVTFNGWQISAYITIGLAALVHIVFYLLFDQNDTDKAYSRKNKRAQNDIEQRKRVADDAIKNAEADLGIIKKITVDIGGLRQRYASLPRQQLEQVLENARQELLKQYGASSLVDAATSALPDIDHSGTIGNEELEEDAPSVGSVKLPPPVTIIPPPAFQENNNGRNKREPHPFP